MDPAKDVDGFHPLNVGRLLMRGSEPAFVPCTALGCMQLLLRSGIDVRGKNAVILVRYQPVRLAFEGVVCLLPPDAAQHACSQRQHRYHSA